MLRLLAISLTVVGLSGCAAVDAVVPQGAVMHSNPTLVSTSDREALWDAIVDVVDDDFEIQREERPRLIGDILTEGRLETRPLMGATVLEPWRQDSVTGYDRWESTLQTIRRRAMVHMVPASGGYEVQIVVLKEMENLEKPQFATTSAATFRNDSSFRRFSDPIGVRPLVQGWIPLGNDVALEQRLLAKLHERVGS